MADRVPQLVEFCRNRMNEELRAVGYFLGDELEFEYRREDLTETYPTAQIEEFIRFSRDLHDDLNQLNKDIGIPAARLHVLQNELFVEFHYPNDNLVFLTMNKTVGQSFSTFIEDCIDHLQ